MKKKFFLSCLVVVSIFIGQIGIFADTPELNSGEKSSEVVSSVNNQEQVNSKKSTITQNVGADNLTEHLKVIEYGLKKGSGDDAVVVDSSNGPIEIKDGDVFTLKVHWEADKELKNNSLTAGQYFEFKLPEGFPMVDSFRIENSVPFGHYKYDKQTQTVKFILNEMVQNDDFKEDYKGDLELILKVDRKETLVDEIVTIINPITNKTDFEFIMKPSSLHQDISKTGKLDKEKNEITWKININENYKKLNNVVLSDVLDSNLELVSVTVQDYQMNAVSGQKSYSDESTQLEKGENYSVGEGNNLQIDLGSITSPKEITIVTKVTKEHFPLIGKEVLINNKAYLKSDELNKESNNVSLGYPLEKVISKDNGVYESEDNTFTWNIDINSTNVNFKKGTIVTDKIYPENAFKYLEDSFVVTHEGKTYSVASFNEEFKEKVQLTLNQKEVEVDGKKVLKDDSFTIEYLTDSTDHFGIKYTTQANWEDMSKIEANGTSNTLAIKYGDEGDEVTGHGKGYGKGIIGKYASIDYVKRDIAWHVSANEGSKNGTSGKHNLDKVVIKDTLEDGKNFLTYKDESFVIKKNGLVLLDLGNKENSTFEIKEEKVSDTVLKVTGTGKSGETFVLTIDHGEKNYEFNYDEAGKMFRAQFDIDYKTSFDEFYHSEIDHVGRFKNIADGEFTSNGVITRGKATSTQEINPEAKNNGLKTGIYNFETKEITWDIYLNYNGRETIDYTINDQLDLPQKFVNGSIELLEYTIDENGKTYINENKKMKLDGSVTDNDTGANLQINIDGKKLNLEKEGYSNRLVVRFKTSVRDNINQKDVINNHAYVKNNHNGKEYPLKGYVNIPNGGQFMSKSVRENEDKNGKLVLDWTLQVNKSATIFDSMEIVDALNSTHTYNEDSFRVIAAKADKNGNLERIRELDNTEFELGFTEAKDSNDHTYQIATITINPSLLKELPTYIIEYSTTPLLEVGQVTYSNKADMNATHKEEEFKTVSVPVDKSYVYGVGSATATSQKLAVIKKDSEGNPIQGVRFGLYYARTGKLVKEQVTNENGELKFENLFTTEYILKELETLPGYGIEIQYLEGIKLQVNDQTTLAANSNNGLVITNHKNAIRIEKKSESTTTDINLSATFEVHKMDDNSLLGLMTTDENGIGYFDNNGKGLLPGKYKIVESIPNAGHIKNNHALEIEVADQLLYEEVVEFTNYQGSVVLTKVDKNNQVIIDPIQFNLVKNDEVIGEYLTQNGIIEINNLEPGNYKFVEQTPESKYLRGNDLEFVVSENETGKPETIKLTAVNYSVNASFSKVDNHGSALEGAKFGLYKIDEDTDVTYETLVNPISEVKSDENGRVRFEKVSVGHYAVKEIEASKGYVLNQEVIRFEIKDEIISEDKEINIYESNFVNYKGQATLTKIDGVTNEVLNGATFSVYKGNDHSNIENNELVESNLVTNEQGQIVLQDLEAGNYFFIETKANEGYYLNSKVVAFTIEETSVNDNQSSIELEHRNYRANVSFVKNDGENGLEGAIFALVKDGVLVGDNYQSNEDGMVTFENIGPGNYEYYEIKAPKGYIIEDRIYNFTVENGIDTQETLHFEATNVENHKGSVVFNKVDQFGNAIEGAQFELRTELGDVIALSESDQSGSVRFDNLGSGNYTIHEIKAATGYILNTASIDVVIPEKATGNYVFATELENNEFVNYQGTLEIHKVDNEGNHLEGATFNLMNDKYEIIDTLTTINGIAKLDKLAPGTYFLEEAIAPKGYELSNERFVIDIPEKYEGQINKLELEVVNIKIEEEIVEPKPDPEDEVEVLGVTKKPKKDALESTTKLPSTGLDNNVVIYQYLMVMAGITFVFFGFKKKKQ